jgi:type VI secretion system protein ImpM
MLERLTRPLVALQLASPPSFWGKLPAHSDYIHQNSHPIERQALHQWIQDQWRHRPDAPACALPEEGWQVTQKPRRTDWSDVPVGFLIPSAMVPFSTRSHMQGVIMASYDKLGRAYPIVMYQHVTTSWVERNYQLDLDQLPSQQGTRNWLFWASRVMSQQVKQQQSIDALQEQVQHLWELYAPGWQQCMGQTLRQPTERAVHAVVRADPAYDPTYDPTTHLNGVSHLPWSDWPTRLTQKKQAQAAFWTQDSQGRYLQAASSLLQLWGVKP